MMHKSQKRLPRGPGGEFWLLVAVLTLLATLALLHVAVQRERDSGLTAIDVHALTDLFSGMTVSFGANRSPS